MAKSYDCSTKIRIENIVIECDESDPICNTPKEFKSMKKANKFLFKIAKETPSNTSFNALYDINFKNGENYWDEVKISNPKIDAEGITYDIGKHIDTKLKGILSEKKFSASDKKEVIDFMKKYDYMGFC